MVSVSKLTKIILTMILLAGATLGVQLVATQRADAAYEPGRIIDDGQFLDARSMSINDIQVFLANKNSGLRNMHFTLSCYGAGSKERQLYVNAGARCDTPIPASEIIYYAAQVYGVNPKVILTTMQKEQSLTTAPNPTSWQLNQAMGYGCPTSGSCDGSSAFPWQIDNGTWALRYHFERARKNMTWWTVSSSWTCGVEKSLYKPNLYPSQNVSFYDTNGTHYTTVFIQNAATSSMYCYTPHAYNNPQGLFGRAPYGNTGLYYSGSWNFVYFYELWFGSTHGGWAPGLSYVSMSGYPTVVAGKEATVTIRYRNISGYQIYHLRGDNRSSTPLVLANTSPINRLSNFGDQSWYNMSRPATQSTVYKEGGSLSSDQGAIMPNDEVVFTYKYSIPIHTKAGVYREWIQPVLEGSASWNLGGVGYFDIRVTQPPHYATFHSLKSYPSGMPGEVVSTWIKYRNSGTSAWYDSTSVPQGQYPVRLANTSPINRASIFHDQATWINNNRPSKQFGAVYESDGVTLAANQHIVQPGQIVKFEFSYRMPFGYTYQSYTEYIQPVLEGSPSWQMGGVGNFLLVHLNRPPSHKLTYFQMSQYPVINRGSEQTAWIKYQNTGASPLYDSTSVPQGQYPVRLANTSPINRASIFHDQATWINNNRPSKQFGAVYESDGVTLAANQHIVQPGQIVKFEFSYRASSDAPLGQHTEYIQPVLEGSPSWQIGGFGYFFVTIK